MPESRVGLLLLDWWCPVEKDWLQNCVSLWCDTRFHNKIWLKTSLSRQKQLYHMTRTAPRAISLQNHKRKGRSDRAGKTRTALLETSAAKSMSVNGKNNILLLPKFVLSTMSHESEHSVSEFYHPGELSHAELLLQSPTHPESKERNLTLLANEEAHNFLRNQQANRRSRKQLFRINCPIINLSNKQTVGETSFLQRIKEFIVGQKKENRRSKQSTISMFSSSFRVSERSWLNQKNHKHTLCPVG